MERSTEHRPRTVPILLIIAVLIGASGCTERHPRTLPIALTATVSFPPEPDEGDTTGVYLGAVLGFDRVGDLFAVPDQRQSKVHLFELDGTYLRSFGREGTGPGEFHTITFLRADPDSESVWVVSNIGNSLLHLTLDYEYLGGYLLPVPGTASFVPLSNGRVVMTCPNGAMKGSLACLDEQGQIVWRASSPLEFAGDRGFLPAVNGSFVCLVGTEIWQVYYSFNLIRVFSWAGESLREFRVRDQGLQEAHEESIRLHKDFIRGRRNVDGNLVPARRILTAARGGRDRCYLLTRGEVLGEGSEKIAVSLYAVGPDGEVVSRYEWKEAPGWPGDFVPLEGPSGFEVAIVTRGYLTPPRISVLQAGSGTD